MIRLQARDGHMLDAYLAHPNGTAKGGLVVAQEMYGINVYLRSVCDFYAAHGYCTIAPALYDRKQRGLIYDYTDDGHDRAQRTYKTWDLELALDDLDAARAAVSDAGKVGLIGFCWGGSLAWLAACRRSYAGTVPYYGSMMPDPPPQPPPRPLPPPLPPNHNTLPPHP